LINQNTIALVTGASRGIGAEIAREFARQGASVILAARTLDEIETIAAEITEGGGTADAVQCDVSNYNDVAAAVALCTRNYGHLDVLVNNAGIIDPIALLTDSAPDAWGRVVDVNIKGVYNGMRAALPTMEAQGSGIIINMSSGAANSALEGWSHYCSTKAAVKSLTRCADKEVRSKGIRVVGLSPGPVATDMFTAIQASGINPVSQLDPSAAIPVSWPARAAVWLCSDEAAKFAGTDFSIKDDEGRQRVGLNVTEAA
jgi:3-oxoacyl-[acyl-carrier protein] reductase